MTIGPRTVMGLALLCALAFSAFAASGASAEGTTLFKCHEEATAVHQFADAHCDEFSAGKNTGLFEHVAIEAAKPQKIVGTNEKTTGLTTQSTTAMFSSTTGGIAVTISCSKVASKGTAENQAGPPMKVAGTGIVITYTGCKVTAPLKAGVEICQLKGEEVKTNELVSETTINGTEMGTKISPKTGTTFTEIALENKGAETCSVKGTFAVEGTVTGTGASNTGGGATATFTEQMTRSTLTFGKQKASYAATETLKIEGGDPVALTTTAT